MKRIAVGMLVAMSAGCAYAEDAAVNPVNANSLIVDVEYVPSTNGVDSAWGFGAYSLQDQNMGISYYANLHISLTKREPHYNNLNINSFGDPVTGRYKELAIANIGVTKKLSENFGVYGGVGYGVITGIARKFDPTYILSNSGNYYVNDPANNKSGVNLNFGALAHFSGYALNIV